MNEQTKLRKLYTKVLGLTEATGDGQKLKEFKNRDFVGGVRCAFAATGTKPPKQAHQPHIQLLPAAPLIRAPVIWPSCFQKCSKTAALVSATQSREPQLYTHTEREREREREGGRGGKKKTHAHANTRTRKHTHTALDCPAFKPLPSLSVRDINRLLDELSRANSLARDEDTTKAEANALADQARQRVVDELLRRGNARENMWLIRIILKDLKIGLKEETVWKAFHRQATEFWGRTPDLEKLCVRLHDPDVNVLEQVRVGQPCGVMLAQDIMKKSIEAVSLCGSCTKHHAASHQRANTSYTG